MNNCLDNRTILVTGGSRSGKSTFAERLGESVEGPKAYVATCPKIDWEMEQRIAKHKASRQGKGWHTVEESLALSTVLSNLNDYSVVLVDCLTLWINNILFEATNNGHTVDENQIVVLVKEIKAVVQQCRFITIFVTNEVGLGLVPPDPISRLYRDLVGRCNQEIAKWADEVVLMTAGIPLKIKEGDFR